MSIRKICRFAAISATLILILIGVAIALSYLIPSLFPADPVPVSLLFCVLSSMSPSYVSGMSDTETIESIDYPDQIVCLTSPFSITIDPIPDVKRGSTIHISGATNLQPGTRISLKVLPVISEQMSDLDQKASCRTVLGIIGSTPVLSGNGSSRTWIWEVNSSELPPNRYEVTAGFQSDRSHSEKTPWIDISGTSRFTLTQEYA